jgi:hypothetical protein
MVSIKYIKSLELEENNLNGYFEYIYLSAVNGNFSQVEELINKLNIPQKKEFAYFINYEVSGKIKRLNDLIKRLI